MKNNRYVKALIMVTLILIWLPSCKKEMTNNHVSISNADQKLERQIQFFQKKISANLKDGEVIDIDSVRWYLEASANFNFGEASAKNENIAIDSFMLKIPISQNSASLDNVESAYNSINENVLDFSNSIPSNEKQTLCIVVKETFQNEDTLKLKVISTIVYGPVVAYGLLNSSHKCNFWISQMY